MARKNKQAMKRHRQNLKRRERNRYYKSTFKSRVRLFVEAIEEKDKQRALEAFRQAQAKIDKAARKGAIHNRTASRKIARLARKLNQMQPSG